MRTKNTVLRFPCNEQWIYIWLYRIRGDQQHFVRRDELKVRTCAHSLQKFKPIFILLQFDRRHGRYSHLFYTELTMVKWSRLHTNEAAVVLQKQMSFWLKLVMFKHKDTFGPSHPIETCYNLVIHHHSHISQGIDL